MNPRQVFAFEVWHTPAHGSTEEHRLVINHRSLPRARAAYWRQASEHLTWLKFTQLRGRKLGAPQTSAELAHTLTYRGLTMTAGTRVVGCCTRGAVIGASDGANLAVLVDDDAPKHAGFIVSFHPVDLSVETP